MRGNYFIPDARKGWIPYAVEAAKKVILEENITRIITTGPPHSTHLVGLQLKAKFNLNWWVDFRDPWSNLFYNKDLYRNQKSIKKDVHLETQVLQNADGVITTIGGKLHEELKSKAPHQHFYALPNGYDEVLMQSVNARSNKAMFHVVYTGLLTHNQPYGSVLKVLNSISIDIPVQLSLAGSIAAEIQSEIRTQYPKITLVCHGYLSHKEAIGLMKSAHLLLNFLFTGAENQMISGKLLEYLATAVPVLSIGDPHSAAGKFLSQGSFATMLEPTDHEAIEGFIQKVATQKGSVHNEFPSLEQWSRKSLTQRLIEVLK